MMVDMSKTNTARTASIHSEMTSDEVRAAADTLAAKLSAVVPTRPSKAFYNLNGKRAAR